MSRKIKILFFLLAVTFFTSANAQYNFKAIKEGIKGAVDKTKSKEKREEAATKRAQEEKLDPSLYESPEKKYKDPDLSIKNISEQYKAASEIAETIIKVFSVGGAGQGDYDIYKDQNTGLPTHKSPTGTFVVVFKDKNGNCFYDTPHCWKDHAGGGTYGDLEIRATSNPTRIACENVK